MTDRIPQMKPREMIRVLEKFGFLVKRQTGSHIFMHNSNTKNTTVIPFHAKDIHRGVLFEMLKQAGISKEDFLKKL